MNENQRCSNNQNWPTIQIGLEIQISQKSKLERWNVEMIFSKIKRSFLFSSKLLENPNWPKNLIWPKNLNLSKNLNWPKIQIVLKIKFGPKILIGLKINFGAKIQIGLESWSKNPIKANFVILSYKI